MTHSFLMSIALEVQGRIDQLDSAQRALFETIADAEVAKEARLSLTGKDDYTEVTAAWQTAIAEGLPRDLADLAQQVGYYRTKFVMMPEQP